MSQKFRSNQELREDPKIVELYDDILRRYPDHPLICEADGIVRWKPKLLAVILKNNLDPKIGLQRLWDAYSRGVLPVEDLAQFYREIGYSLGGFCELFELPLGLKSEH